MSIRHHLLLLIAIAPCITRADHYEVYLIAGQSNAGGHGYVSRTHALFSPQGDDGLVELGQTSYLEPQADTLFLHWRGGNPTSARPTLWDARTDGWIPLKAGYSLFSYNPANPSALGDEIANHPFGAEITFAERIREARPGRKIAIIKYTQGATTLGTTAAPGAWDPSAGRTYNLSTLANPGHCYRGFLDLVQQGLNTLAHQGHSTELRGLIWHQGESDSGLTTEVYKDRLKTFITAVRTDLQAPQLPFVIGELIQTASYANTRTAQRLAATETPNSAFVSSVGLAGDSTTIHFDTTAQLLFGRRYAEAMLHTSTRQLRRNIAHWKLDEPSLQWRNTFTPVLDSISNTAGSLYGYTENELATVNSDVVHQEGPTPEDRSYNFAHDPGIGGVNTHRPDALPATGDFTLLVRFKTTDPHTSQGHLFSNNNGQAARANLFLHNGTLSWFHHGGVTLTESASPVFDGQWHEVGVIRQGSTWKLLRNRQTVATATSNGSIGQDTEWMIGRMRSFNGNFEGSIADVRILNYPITSQTVILQSQLSPSDPCSLSWTSEPHLEYAIEWSLNLTHWHLLDLVPAHQGDSTTFSFSPPPNTSRAFFRIR